MGDFETAFASPDFSSALMASGKGRAILSIGEKSYTYSCVRAGKPREIRIQQVTNIFSMARKIL
jgi:hypothetical protein